VKHRFFVPPESIGRVGVLFPQESAQQIRRVLRLRPGSEVAVLDGLGWEYRVKLETVSNEKVWGRLEDRQPAGGEPVLQVTLYLSLTQREKFEWALQKCTEVGVSTFVPVISDRTLSRDKDKALQKMDRWTRILREAAEQCGRGLVPQITEPLALEEALQQATDANLPAVFLWENEQERLLYSWLQEYEGEVRGANRLGLFVGPEGGFSDEEAAQAVERGIQTVSLGARILRMETAAVVASALPLQVLE
jgi:16S rRNA (uracil1498-N3)-methyltransferase